MSDGLTTEFSMMSLALYVAYRALRNNETPVACIMVDKNIQKVLSVGYNGTNDTLNGTRHAEFIAIDSIFDQFIPKEKHGDAEYVRSFFSNVILYVTVEPCVMCASALKQIGIKRAVYGCGNDRFGGNGTVLKINDDEIDGRRGNYKSYGGVLRSEAVQLLRNFYIQENDTAPKPKIKSNKQISEKKYTPNIDFFNLYTSDEFNDFYTCCDPNLFHVDHEVFYEITPNGDSYSLNEYISENTVNMLPDLPQLFGGHSSFDVVEDIETFCSLFYDIKHQKVDFSKTIQTVEDLTKYEKKRKLDQD
ncbi:tRNA(adenine34) deaminase [Yamadazyma tenuis]|uniref:Cytidine deaminase-like protein n=1 Tax=Candida tenuis (strain ATCC 10573 / BCRC 21748 / CBS 615 / JCM 9827 / NBRC 10315 / NRRL Y-1498 / VKM Y-70) TaxID=590646 RepID=G3AYF2_CANTC|nr:cytidine deaminase-like protein [Yamadazyma tenuis ATCC 10573]EGV65836.1 cytidine deaminase-like protein [Yamadazyma tenuis ATCC 10573]WEJ95834.1 tRNA(adenine34) deaminase [Yamadazyma tenuis]